MLRVFILIAPSVQERINGEVLGRLGETLINNVEEVFGIKTKNLVGFTALNTAHVINEADIQIEVRYTVQVEYIPNTGFNLTWDERRGLVSVLGKTARKHLSGLVKRVSIWPIPISDSEFYMTDMFPKGYEDIESAPEKIVIPVMWGDLTKNPEYGQANKINNTWYIRSDPNPHANGRECATPTAWCPTEVSNE
jgi:hypothetical protein